MTQDNSDKIDMEPGIYNDISFEDYKKIDAINHSTLKAFMRESPFHYRYKKESGTLFKDTKATSEGRMIHEAILEPKLFEEKYVEEPTDWREYEPALTKAERDYCLKKEKEAGKEGEGGFNFISANSNAYKSIMTFFESKIGKKQEVITSDLLWRIKNIKENISEDPAFQTLFEDADFETTLVWIDEETELKCKGRIDVDPKTNKYMGDLKKTQSCHPYGFARDVRKYNYNSAAAFYIDGAVTLGRPVPNAFIWLCVEAEDPFYTLPFWVKSNSDWITSGRVWYRQAIEKLHYCQSTGDWHGYYDSNNDSFKMYELPELNY